MKTRTVPRKSAYVLALAILVAASFLAGSIVSRGQPVNAQGASSSVAPAAPDGAFWCTIGEIFLWENRIHVKCTNGPVPIVFFAYPVTSAAESRQANRYLAILNTAFALNKQVLVGYDDSAGSNPPGCWSGDCRRLYGVGIQP